jgi:hypothetical protein
MKGILNKTEHNEWVVTYEPQHSQFVELSLHPNTDIENIEKFLINDEHEVEFTMDVHHVTLIEPSAPKDVEKTWKEINMEAFDAGYYQRHGLIQYLIRNYNLPTKK